MKKYFNLETLVFQENKPTNDYYLTIANCEHLEKPIISINKDGEEDTHLHNDEFCEDGDEDKAVELFRKEDINFLNCTDMFTNKNTRIENPIIPR